MTDVFAINAHFGQTGDPEIDPLSDASGPGYHTRYDRSPVGPSSWISGPPDGSIAVTDVFRVLAQFGHSCI